MQDVLDAGAVGEDLDAVDEAAGVRAGELQGARGAVVAPSFTLSPSTKSMPLVSGMRHTRLVVGVKTLSELG